MLNKYLIIFIKIIVYFAAAGLVSCTSGSGETRPTQTAQAERAIQQATQIVRSRLSTQEAAERSLSATAQAAREIAALQWTPLISDEFDDNRYDWALGEEQDDALANISWSLTGGAYRWDATAVEPFIWWVTPSMDPFADFYVSVEARQLSGPDSGEFGIVFRRSDELGYYLFEVNAKQHYSVSRYDYPSETWTILMDWSPSSALRSGWANSLAVVGQADKFFFFINSERVAEIQDDAIPTGAAGLVVGLSNPGDEAAWEFDRFELRTPDLQEEDLPLTPTP